MYTSVRIKC